MLWVWVNSVGNGSGFGHPAHLHGHSFHVVDIGYGKYDNTTEIVNGTNSDISCQPDDKCSYPEWTNGVAPFKDVSITMQVHYSQGHHHRSSCAYLDYC